MKHKASAGALKRHLLWGGLVCARWACACGPHFGGLHA